MFTSPKVTGRKDFLLEYGCVSSLLLGADCCTSRLCALILLPACQQPCWWGQCREEPRMGKVCLQGVEEHQQAVQDEITCCVLVCFYYRFSETWNILDPRSLAGRGLWTYMGYRSTKQTPSRFSGVAAFYRLQRFVVMQTATNDFWLPVLAFIWHILVSFRAIYWPMCSQLIISGAELFRNKFSFVICSVNVSSRALQEIMLCCGLMES